MCEIYSVAKKEHGDVTAIRIFKIISVLKNEICFDNLIKSHIYGCHALNGDRKGQYGFYLEHPYRLVVKPLEKNTIALVIEVVDYHDKKK